MIKKIVFFSLLIVGIGCNNDTNDFNDSTRKELLELIAVSTKPLVLRCRYFEGIDLSNINLSRADLSGAMLKEANLTLTDLSGANLTKADLSKANLFC